MDYHNLELCGLKRKLPLIHISKNTRFASFNLMGDVKLVNAVANEIITKLKSVDFDYLVGPEVKVVPLISELARRLNHDHFVICRKSVKPYMSSPIILKPLDYFPKHVKQLVIDGFDAEILKNKRVVIIDDVISTGVTIRMMTKLMSKVGAEVVATVAVLKQGKQFDEIKNFIFLGEIPILTEDKEKK